MTSPRLSLEEAMQDALREAGLNAALKQVRRSDRPDLADYQSNAAMAAAKAAGRNPREVAADLQSRLAARLAGIAIEIAGPGFINFRLGAPALGDALSRMSAGGSLAVPLTDRRIKIVMDYGGPNIAKHMHVGHVRSSVIGEALKRMARAIGHEVLADIHLGDWGLQMGMVLFGIEERQPDLPYFKADSDGPYPDRSPVSLDELETIYPDVAERVKNDAALRDKVGRMTVELQRGRPGYRALWRHIEAISLDEIRKGMARLGIAFDQWFGESRYQARIPDLVRELKEKGIAIESEGALVIPVAEPSDKKEMPPVFVQNSRGGDLYHTTDLATLEERVKVFGAELVLYVVDSRQALHFEQLFRAAEKMGLGAHSRFEHLGFGTMNGTDGKPFKTRAGGVVRLKDLVDALIASAAARLKESERAAEWSPQEAADIAEKVGVATLKFADLQHDRKSNYLFDAEKFSRFEGKTGPYLQYSAVRIRSILAKAEGEGLKPGPFLLADSGAERALAAALVRYGDELHAAFEARGPHLFCDYLFEVAQAFSQFYHATHILSEPDKARQASHLALAALTLRVLTAGLNCLGIDVPSRM